ncbi:ABC transporter permease [Microlunatus panaciterrae]|uniref:ABC-2 type transport system permease protein n=1 Tax=Microlunatus panaciterrae TaxID=400768 RepID=A0ABS2RIP4_9ACTN|nr:ABC transporter permease subunit [Microlunatus panaciterrae]MBM7798842.1 ABC-2 type transport system permease protein [Microlunatus panaciterrae]
MSAADAPPRTRPVSLRFLRSELRVIFGRRRNLAGLGVLALVPILIAVAVKVSSPGGDRGGPDFIASITGNGIFVALAALTIELVVFLPLAVAAISADAVAGEANIGTLRYLLTVPVERTRLLAVKYLAVVIFTFVATLTVAGVGVIIGLALFGGGDMTLLSGTRIPMAAALGRVLLTVLYLTAGFAALGAIGLFVSTLTEQPIAATIAIVILNVMSFTLDSIQQLSWLHPWLFTHWWTAFGDLYRDPIVWDSIFRGLLVAAGYALVFWLAAWARFSNKDITS